MGLAHAPDTPLVSSRPRSVRRHRPPPPRASPLRRRLPPSPHDGATPHSGCDFGLAVRWHTPVLAGTTILDIDTEPGRNVTLYGRSSGDLHERELLSALTVATMALGILEFGGARDVHGQEPAASRVTVCQVRATGGTCGSAGRSGRNAALSCDRTVSVEDTGRGRGGKARARAGVSTGLEAQRRAHEHRGPASSTARPSGRAMGVTLRTGRGAMDRDPRDCPVVASMLLGARGSTVTATEAWRAR
ncbi:hypothetical protein VTO73DRAFT_8694 [Trametes versicolor]